MNQSYFQSVINDREREVVKHVGDNRIYKHHKKSIEKRQGAAEKGMNGLSSWIWMIAKRLKGVFRISEESDVKV